ncbi:MAG: hypothetical protein IT227_12425 [Flavobacteriales bacterium]|jgi:hypothetical protein|nr:hypothetical protein [Flavobacteriales bacterium]
MPAVTVRDLRRRRTTVATVVFLSVALGILWWGQVMGDLDGTIALGMIGACATVYIGLLNYWLQRDKVMQDLFTAFNARYDRLNGDLLAIQKGVYMDGDPDRVILDYLNLCAEEYFWYTRGRIDTAIWLAWRNGMENWLQVPAVRDVARREAAQRDSYYGLFDTVPVD